jgi:hypothetical protein
VTFASAPVVQNEARREVQQTPAQAAEMQRATTDAEVLAALASLSPTQTEAAVPVEESASGNGNQSGAQHAEHQAVAAAGASGPRWIAQSVAIADDESTIVLEREMEKAYAAMAALEAEETSAAVAEPDAAIAVQSAEPSAENVSVSAVEPSQPSQTVESLPVPEVPTPVIAESVPEVSSPEPAVPETSLAAPEILNAVSETSVPVSQENAAYAAAASAGSNVSEPVESSPAAVAPTAAESIPHAVESNPGRESELAAAWQNWKQIRESILGSQLPKDVAQAAAAAGFEGVPKHEPAAEASSEGGPSESAAIANIVDSVLAELKPKLMEEISKKMKKDKKK